MYVNNFSLWKHVTNNFYRCTLHLDIISLLFTNRRILYQS